MEQRKNYKKNTLPANKQKYDKNKQQKKNSIKIMEGTFN